MTVDNFSPHFSWMNNYSLQCGVFVGIAMVFLLKVEGMLIRFREQVTLNEQINLGQKQSGLGISM